MNDNEIDDLARDLISVGYSKIELLLDERTMKSIDISLDEEEMTCYLYKDTKNRRVKILQISNGVFAIHFNDGLQVSISVKDNRDVALTQYYGGNVVSRIPIENFDNKKGKYKTFSSMILSNLRSIMNGRSIK